MIKVFQGDAPLTKDCVEIGSFEMRDFAVGPNGKAKIGVVFAVSQGNMLVVTATDEISKK